MNNKLDILLECLPEAPFKEQLKQAIKEKIEYEAQKARTMLGVIYAGQGIMNKLREILQCKEGESIVKVAEYRMKRIDELEYILEGLEK